MAQMLIVNPSSRKGGHRAKKRRTARKRNPMPAALKRYWATHRRGRKGTHAGARRRRRNPLRIPGLSRMGVLSNVMPLATDAAIGAAGSIGVDYLWGQVNPKLPTTLQTVSGKPGVGDAVKVLATVALGSVANRFTRGAGGKLARGALTVQFDRLLRGMLPATITSQLGYASPAAVTDGTWWAGPNRVFRGSPLRLPTTMGRLAALQRPGGRTPLLNALQTPGGRTPLLSAYMDYPGMPPIIGATGAGIRF